MSEPARPLRSDALHSALPEGRRPGTLCGAVSFRRSPVALSALGGMLGARDGRRLQVVTADGAVFAALVPGGADGPLLRRDGRPEQGALLLAADARLDNRDELLRALGLERAAPSDAALLAAAYERWGESSWHRRLRGAFAAAVYDRAAGKLLLLRDRAGERALYWCRTPDGILFALEPAQLVASGRIGGEPHAERLLAYLLGAPADPTWSYFARVHRLPEGCQARLTAGGVELERYWDWTAVAGDDGGRDAAPELADRLQAAVDRRLASAGETGVLLSGGLDSASVAAQAADSLAAEERDLYAFTWTSRGGDGIDETPRSRTFVASRPNVVERPVEADALWPFSRFPEAWADPNDPETNALPDLLLATLEEARRQNVGALMNGIGGDPVAGWLAPELGLLLRGRFGALARRWRAAGPRHAGLLREMRSLVRRPLWPDWLTKGARRLAREAGFDRPAASWRVFASRDRFRRFALASPVNAASLERFDRLSRRCGVRVEAPWHDTDLAALVLALPDRALADAPPAKPLLRRAMDGRLPAAILAAPPADGRGRSTLRARGLLGGGRPAVERLLGDSRLATLGLLDGARLLAAYREGAARQTLPPKLWEVLTTESWLLASGKL